MLNSYIAIAISLFIYLYTAKYNYTVAQSFCAWLCGKPLFCRKTFKVACDKPKDN